MLQPFTRAKITNKEHYLAMHGRFNCKLLKELIFTLFAHSSVKTLIYVDINTCRDFHMLDYRLNLVPFLNIHSIASHVKLYVSHERAETHVTATRPSLCICLNSDYVNIAVMKQLSNIAMVRFGSKSKLCYFMQ